MNERIQIAIVGLRFGENIVQQITSGPAAAFFELAAVCDQDQETVNRIATRMNVPAYTSLDDLLRRVDIPAIGLFTGPIHRSQLIRKILKAGKHTLTTKPFELEPYEAHAVLQEAHRVGKIIHLNSPAPLIPPDLAQIQAWVEELQLGRPMGARAEAWHGGGISETADGSWYDNPELCPVAPMYRIGIYLINDLIRIWGPVERVQIMDARLCTGRPTPDTAASIIRFQNGALGVLFTSLCIDDGEPGETRLTLNYERGTIYRNIGPWAPDALEYDNQARMELVCSSREGKKIIRSVKIDGVSGSYQWEAFYKAIRGEHLPHMVDPEVIVMGLRTIQALRRASLSQKAEPV